VSSTTRCPSFSRRALDGLHRLQRVREHDARLALALGRHLRQVVDLGVVRVRVDHALTSPRTSGCRGWPAGSWRSPRACPPARLRTSWARWRAWPLDVDLALHAREARRAEMLVELRQRQLLAGRQRPFLLVGSPARPGRSSTGRRSAPSRAAGVLRRQRVGAVAAHERRRSV
jgi:hypothetical protein